MKKIYKSDGGHQLSNTDHRVRQMINQMSVETDRNRRYQIFMDSLYDICAGAINEAPPSQRTVVREIVTSSLRTMSSYFVKRAREMGVPADDVRTMIDRSDHMAMNMAPDTKDGLGGKVSAYKKPHDGLFGPDGVSRIT